MAEMRSIEVTAPVWWLLAERAEAQGVTVAEYLVIVSTSHVIGAKTGPRAGDGVTTARVAELHALGKTDRQMGIHLSIGVHAVMYHRKKLGLKPNPARGLNP